MVILNVMLCLILTNFRINTKKPGPTWILQSKVPPQRMECEFLLEVVLWAMNKYECVDHLKGFPKHSSELMLSTHYCSPKGFKTRNYG